MLLFIYLFINQGYYETFWKSSSVQVLVIIKYVLDLT